MCQDFAHLAIGAGIGETVRGASHAWVERWTGDWFGFDPTNDREVADHHVVVARAREYRDVKPVSGVFGGSASNLRVDVMVTLVA